MKKWLLALVAAFSLSGCVMYADYPASSECTTFCDDYGCREVCSSYYYDSAGVMYYWDPHFGVWIGPHGYYHGGVFYHGYYPGYHVYYHRGWYGPHGGYHYYRGGHWRR